MAMLKRKSDNPTRDYIMKLMMAPYLLHQNAQALGRGLLSVPGAAYEGARKHLTGQYGNITQPNFDMPGAVQGAMDATGGAGMAGGLLPGAGRATAMLASKTKPAFGTSMIGGVDVTGLSPETVMKYKDNPTWLEIHAANMQATKDAMQPDQWLQHAANSKKALSQAILPDEFWQILIEKSGKGDALKAVDDAYMYINNDKMLANEVKKAMKLKGFNMDDFDNPGDWFEQAFLAGDIEPPKKYQGEPQIAQAKPKATWDELFADTDYKPLQPGQINSKMFNDWANSTSNQLKGKDQIEFNKATNAIHKKLKENPMDLDQLQDELLTGYKYKAFEPLAGGKSPFDWFGQEITKVIETPGGVNKLNIPQYNPESYQLQHHDPTVARALLDREVYHASPNVSWADTEQIRPSIAKEQGLRQHDYGSGAYFSINPPSNPKAGYAFNEYSEGRGAATAPGVVPGLATGKYAPGNNYSRDVAELTDLLRNSGYFGNVRRQAQDIVTEKYEGLGYQGILADDANQVAIFPKYAGKGLVRHRYTKEPLYGSALPGTMISGAQDRRKRKGVGRFAQPMIGGR